MKLTTYKKPPALAGGITPSVKEIIE